MPETPVRETPVSQRVSQSVSGGVPPHVTQPGSKTEFADMLGEIQRARRHVDALCLALQSPSPEEMELCLPALAEAVACLQSVEHALREQSLSPGTTSIGAIAFAGHAAVRGAQAGVLEMLPLPAVPLQLAPLQTAPIGLPILHQLHSLNNELDIAQRLVIHGAAYCDTWSRMLGGAEGGYVASGDPAPLSAPGNVSVKG